MKPFAVDTCGSVGTPACRTRPQRGLVCGVSFRGAVGRFARVLGSFVACLIAAMTPILGIWLFRGSLDGSEQFLLLLLGLSFSSHEGDDDFKLRLLLEPELCGHGDIPLPAGLAG